MFTRRHGKMKVSEVENLELNTLMNIMYHGVEGNTAAQKYNDDITSCNHLKWGLHSSSAVKDLGSPNVTMMQYESRPGAWVFDHSTGIVLVIFSDGHRKNPSKGTSYEIANIPDDFSDEMLCQIYDDIVSLITK